jgi:NhaA family Na+:H+ antiporter
MLHTGVLPALGGVLLGLLTPLAPRAGRANLVADASSALQEFEQRAQLDAGKPQRLVPIARQLHRTQRELLPPLVRVETALHPWVAYAIVPLFALANAGVDLRGIGTTFEAAPTLTLGIVLGLVLGKPAGIAFATWLTLRLGLSALPSGIDARGIMLVGTLAGIGFTMSIFIATLSLADAGLLSAAKLAVLIASFCAAAIGLGAGRFLLRSNA